MPCKNKSFQVQMTCFKAFALTGRIVYILNTQGVALGLGASALLGRVGQICFQTLPFPSAGDRWFRACGSNLLLTFTLRPSSGEAILSVCHSSRLATSRYR